MAAAAAPWDGLAEELGSAAVSVWARWTSGRERAGVWQGAAGGGDGGRGGPVVAGAYASAEATNVERSRCWV